jgi:hypothetical protein
MSGRKSLGTWPLRDFSRSVFDQRLIVLSARAFSLIAVAQLIRHGRGAVHWLAAHTGVPALFVAALLVVLGYRILKRSARFALEVALVAAMLVMATELGWIRW